MNIQAQRLAHIEQTIKLVNDDPKTVDHVIGLLDEYNWTAKDDPEGKTLIALFLQRRDNDIGIGGLIETLLDRGFPITEEHLFFVDTTSAIDLARCFDLYFQNPQADHATDSRTMVHFLERYGRYAFPYVFIGLLDVAQQHHIEMEAKEIANILLGVVAERKFSQDRIDDAILCLDRLEQHPNFDVNALSFWRMPALMFCKHGSIAKWLLERGADPMVHHIKEGQQVHVLYQAWEYGADAQTLTYLLQYGAAVDTGPSVEELLNHEKDAQEESATEFLLQAWRRHNLSLHIQTDVERAEHTIKI